MRPTTVRNHRKTDKPLPVTLRRIISNGSLEHDNGTPSLVIRMRTPGCRPASMATQARYVCDWLNKHCDDSGCRQNRVVEYPDFNNKKEHSARISLSDNANRKISDYLQNNR